MSEVDVVIYADGLDTENKELIKQLHHNTIFKEMIFPEEWNDIINHWRTVKWGKFILVKFYAYELIKIYDKVLFFDADILIRGDISELFEIEEDMAWRRVLAWNPQENFKKHLRRPNDYISSGNGGLLFFNKSISEHNIGNKEILDAFEKVKDLDRGACDETVIAMITYDKKFTIRELDADIWNIPARRALPESKFLHFLDYQSKATKPWKNLAAFLYFDDWAENYNKWIEMGGEGPINFTKEDYYKLFGFEQEITINKQKKKLQNLQEQINKLNNPKINYEKKYNDIINSKSWKITKPLRKISKMMKKGNKENKI